MIHNYHPSAFLIRWWGYVIIVEIFYGKEGIITNHTTKKKTWNGFSAAVLVITILAELLAAGAVWKLQVLPAKFMALGGAGLVIVDLLIASLLFQKAGKWQKTVRHTKQILGYVLCLVLIIGCAFGIHAIFKINQTVTAITQPTTISTIYGVYVLAEDPAQTIEDAAGYSLAVSGTAEETGTVAQEIAERMGVSAPTHIPSINELVDALYGGQFRAIVLNLAYADILPEVEGYEDFTSRARLLYEHTITEEVDVTEPIQQETAPDETQETEPVVIDIDPTTMPFIMYLSGSDTRASVLVKSRSDVNILAAVNPVTKQILLVNTPRDYYVANAAGNGEMDKLTHHGLYGVENST